MQEQNPFTITRISKIIDLGGYVLDSDILKRIDEISRQSVIGSAEKDSDNFQYAYWGFDHRIGHFRPLKIIGRVH